MVIKVFSVPECPYCAELKERLKNMGIKFIDVDVSIDENEEEFKKVMEVSKSDLVPTITVGKHLLAPDLNFSTIEEAANIVKYIVESEI